MWSKTIFKAGVFLAFLALIPKATSAGPSHQLSPVQVAQLKGLKIKIVVPGFVPPGYKLTNFFKELLPQGGPGGGGGSYILQYSCFCGGHFTLEGAAGGIGSMIPGPESEEKVWNAVLGTLPLGTYRHQDGISYSTDWFGKGPFNSFEGFAMSKSDAEKIVKALTVL